MVMEENTTGLATGSRQNSYGYSGKIMLISVVVLFAVCVAIVCFRSYAHWVVRRRVRSLGRRPRRASLHSLYSDADATPPDQGLHSSVLKSLPNFLYASAAHDPPLYCAVCLSEFQDNESARLLPKCSHCFHPHCIDAWFRSHSNCPLCRAPVQPLFPLQTIEPAGPRSGSGCRIPSSSRSADDEQEPPEPECLAVAVEVPIRLTSNARLEERDMDRRLKDPGVRVGSLRRFLSI